MKNLTKMGLLFLAGFSFAAQSGTIFVTKTSADSGDDVSRTFYQDDMLRIDSNGQQDNSSMIYDVQANVFYMIDHDEKSYTRIDKASMKKLVVILKNSKQRMKEQLASMPKEQQAMMSGMMGGMYSKDKPKSIYKLVKTSKSDKVLGIDCQQVDSFKNGKKHSELCIASLDDLPNGNEMFKAFAGMTKMLSDFMKEMPMADEDSINANATFKQLNGFPIIDKETKNGRVTSISKLFSVKEVKLDASKFEVPQGYRKEDFEKQFSF